MNSANFRTITNTAYTDKAFYFNSLESEASVSFLGQSEKQH